MKFIAEYQNILTTMTRILLLKDNWNRAFVGIFTKRTLKWDNVVGWNENQSINVTVLLHIVIVGRIGRFNPDYQQSSAALEGGKLWQSANCRIKLLSPTDETTVTSNRRLSASELVMRGWTNYRDSRSRHNWTTPSAI